MRVLLTRRASHTAGQLRPGGGGAGGAGEAGRAGSGTGGGDSSRSRVNTSPVGSSRQHMRHASCMQGRKGKGRTGQGGAGQDRAGQGEAGQGRTGQGRTGRGRTGRTGRGRTGRGWRCHPVASGAPPPPPACIQAQVRCKEETQAGGRNPGRCAHDHDYALRTVTTPPSLATSPLN